MIMYYTYDKSGYLTGMVPGTPSAQSTIEAPPECDATKIQRYIGGGWIIEDRSSTTLLADAKSALVLKIDADVDVIYALAVGNRGPEYDLAAAEAQTFASGGYTGTVPASVQAWATAKAWTPTVAADDILAATARLATARDAIRAQRLLRKEQARIAASEAALETIAAQWNGFVTVVKSQLGVT